MEPERRRLTSTRSPPTILIGFTTPVTIHIGAEEVFNVVDYRSAGVVPPRLRCGDQSGVGVGAAGRCGGVGGGGGK